MGAAETSKAFNVPIVNDDTPEGPEEFTITLTLDPATGSYAQLGNPAVMTVTIPINDDAAGVFGFAPSSLLVSVPTPAAGADPTSVALAVTRSRGAVGEASVFWFIQEDGADSTFEAASGTIVFADGDVSAVITLHVLHDPTPHFVKPFTVTLVSSHPSSLPYQPAHMLCPTSHWWCHPQPTCPT